MKYRVIFKAKINKYCIQSNWLKYFWLNLSSMCYPTKFDDEASAIFYAKKFEEIERLRKYGKDKIVYTSEEL